MKKSEIAIIIPCKNEGIYIKQTIDFLLKTEAKDKADIIIVDDHSNDSCCDFLKSQSKYYPKISLIQTDGIGAARARNLGAGMAAAADIIVFCDAHITMEKDWLNIILDSFSSKEAHVVCPGIGRFEPGSPAGYGQTWNQKFQVCWLKKPQSMEEVPLAPGACMAVKQDVFEKVAGFDPGFFSWGYEDVELSLKLWLFGYKIYVQPKVRIGHKFRKIQPYDVDTVDFNYNRLRMAFSHFNDARVLKVLEYMKDYSQYEKVLEKINASDTLKQRESYLKKRMHDDDWFFKRFDIPF